MGGLVALALLGQTPAAGATYTWTNGSGNSTWNTSLLNWTLGSGNVAWVAGNDAVFDSTGSGGVTVSGSQSITSLLFSASGYTLSGGTIGLASGTTAITANAAATIGSVIAGGNALLANGTSTLTLSASNSFTGGVIVSAGQLAVGNTGALGTGAATVNGGELFLGSFSPTVGGFTIASGSLTGSGKLSAGIYGLGGGTVAANLGSGTVNVTANSTLNGTTDATRLNLNSGTLALGSGARFTSPSVVVTGSSGGVLALGGNETIGSLQGSANVNLGNNTLSIRQVGLLDATYSGVISGSGGVVMDFVNSTGNSVLRLNQPQAFTGGMTVNGGYLVLNAANSLAASGVVILNGGGIDIGGSGSATAQTWAGLSGTGLSGTASGIYASAGTTLTLNVATGTSYTYSGALGTGGGFNGTGFGLVKSGGGTQVLSGSNLFTGALTVSGGQLSLNSTINTLTVNVNSGTLALGSGGLLRSSAVVTGSIGGVVTLGGNETIGSLRGGVYVGLGNNTLSIGQVGALDATYSGVISGSGGVVMNFINSTGISVLRLNQPQTFTGGLTVNNGYLVLNAGNALTATGVVNLNGGAIDMSGQAQALAGLSGTGGGIYNFGNNGSALTLTVATGTSYTYSGALGSGGGFSFPGFAVVKAGGGTQVLSGSSSYTGTTNVSAGTLQFTRPAALYNGGTASWTAANITTGSGGTLALSVGASNFTTGNVTTLLTNLGGLGGSVNNNGLRAGSSIGFDTSTAAGNFTVADNIRNSTGTGGGAIGVVKLGSGTLTLTGSNTFSGATTISAGILSFGTTTALASTSGVGIAAGGRLQYTGSTTTFDRNVTVTTASGTGTIENTGGGVLTLSGALSKDNSVLRLTGGSFNVTGLITGTTPGTSDLVIDAAAVTLSNTNTYNGPTFVYNSGTLTLGVNNAIPNNSVVTLGNASGAGTLVTSTWTDAIGGLAFSGLGGTLRLTPTASQTSTIQLSSSGTIALGGAPSTLDLTGMATGAGLYRLISGASLTGTFGTVTGLDSNYVLRYGTVNANELDAQRKANQASTFTMTTGTVTRALVNTSVAVSGTITNSSPTNSTALTLGLASTGLSGSGFTAGSVSANLSLAVTGTLATGSTVGTQNWSITNIDTSAITGTSAATGSLQVVNQRSFSVSNSGTIALGNFLRTAAVTGSTTISSTGLNDTTANASLAAFTGTNTNGFSLATLQSSTFNGAQLNQSALYTLSGSAAAAGGINGTFTSLVTAELGSINPLTVSLTGTAYDPATAVLASGGSAIGNAWTISLGEFNQGAGFSTPWDFAISNLLASNQYTADLVLDSFSVASDSGAIFMDLSGTSFQPLIAGGTNPFTAWMSLANTGTFTNVYELNFASAKNNQTLGGSQNVTLTVTGIIVVPEPGALALAGIGIGFAGWLARRRT